MEEIVNKVKRSGLIQFDLEDIYPQGKRIVFDLKDCLWQGIALKEKDYRNYLKEKDWSEYKDAYVSIICSADAIVPTWAFMVAASTLQNIAKRTFFGTLEEVESTLMREAISKLPVSDFEEQRIIVKGCGKLGIGPNAYVDFVNHIQNVAKSIMYGEPCSTVPVFKKAKV